METATIIAAIAVFAVAAGLAVWLIPRRQRQRWERSGVAGKDLAELENSSRATLVQLLGGVALILTFVATWLQISDARDASEETLRLTAAQQATERFTRAVEQLGSPRPELRLGGIYGLEQAARDSPSRRETVGQLMLAYLKTNHPFDPFRQPKKASDLEVQIQIAASTDSSLCERPAGTPLPDTQAALTVLLGIPEPQRPQLDLTGVDLSAVRANGADFTGALLRRASLAGAKLSDAVFDEANISGETDLRGACFWDASFRGAYIGLVDAVAADFSGADFSGMRQPPVLRGAIGP